MRNARSEENAAAGFEKLRQRHLEDLCNKVQLEFEKEAEKTESKPRSLYVLTSDNAAHNRDRHRDLYQQN